MKEKINTIIKEKEDLMDKVFKNQKEFKTAMKEYLANGFGIPFNVYENIDDPAFPSLVFKGKVEEDYYIYLEFDEEEYGLIDYKDETEDKRYHLKLIELISGLNI